MAASQRPGEITYYEELGVEDYRTSTDDDSATHSALSFACFTPTSNLTLS